MPNLATKQEVDVSHTPGMVQFKVGNVEFEMGYEDALTWAQWTFTNAKEAKRLVGDTSRRFRLSGILSDAEENYKRGI